MKRSLKGVQGISAFDSLLISCAGLMGLKKSVAQLPEGFTVTAHTGCEKTKDNSLESVSAAIKAGADITEFDLRFDGEGKGILSHDEGEKNPVTLDEAFALVATDDKIKINIDVKSADNMREVYLLSEKHGITDRIFYTGIEQEKVETVKTETPEVFYYLNYAADPMKSTNDKYIKELIDLVKKTGAVGLNVKYLRCSKKLIKAFRKEGLKVSVWTANDVFSMLACLSMTPDNITTRYPSMLIKLIEFFR